jgi:hypothetical protein
MTDKPIELSIEVPAALRKSLVGAGYLDEEAAH